MTVIPPNDLRALAPVIRQQLRPDRHEPMDGWTNSDRGIELAKHILERKPSVVVEIGVFGGRSLIAVALALRQNGKGRIYGIDPWKKTAFEGEDPKNKEWWDSLDLDAVHTKAMHAIWELNLDDYVCIIRSASHTVAGLFPKIDMVNIDGCHSELCATRDVEMYVPRVVPGGLVFMDDVDWHQDGKPTMTKPLKLLNELCVPIKEFENARLYEKK